VSPTPTYIEPPRHSGLVTALMAGAIIALIGANIYLYSQIDHMRTDMATTHEKVMTEISNLRDASSVTSASQMRHIDTLKEELAAARSAAQRESSQAKAESLAHADQIARQIQAEEAKQQQQVNSEISEAKQSASQANAQVAAKVADVATDVGSVKTEVAHTQADLQKTINDLKSAQGDLGVQSGLIATNHNELDALRKLGERNYVDIKLGKTKQPVRFADITLKLVSVTPKKNKYSVDVVADDKLTEKKDRNINEPVQFYTSKGGHIPYELVINQVGKDQIVGYLSTPKVEASR
jgi:DNA repair exonuclease SbcCD ATPase subunit